MLSRPNFFRVASERGGEAYADNFKTEDDVVRGLALRDEDFDPTTSSSFE
jgi:hypothetical protein